MLVSLGVGLLQITHLAGSRVKTVDEFNALKDQLIDDEVLRSHTLATK